MHWLFVCISLNHRAPPLSLSPFSSLHQKAAARQLQSKTKRATSYREKKVEMKKNGNDGEKNAPRESEREKCVKPLTKVQCFTGENEAKQKTSQGWVSDGLSVRWANSTLGQLQRERRSPLCMSIFRSHDDTSPVNQCDLRENELTWKCDLRERERERRESSDEDS